MHDFSSGCFKIEYALLTCVVLCLFQEIYKFRKHVRIKSDGTVLRLWFDALNCHNGFCFSGMTSNDFKGFPSIQEVGCSGESLEAEVKILSLTMFKTSDNSVLVYANPLTNDCFTGVDFSSCLIDTIDKRNSRVRVLVYDLQEGETRQYGCNVSSFKHKEQAGTITWSILVRGKSEY